MYRRANYLLYYIIAAGLTSLALLGSCTNDLKKIQEISAKQVNSNVDTTRGVDIILSDSAKVKARLLSPLMLQYDMMDANKTYMVLPKGVKIIMYDKTLHEEATIIADTAYQYGAKKLIKLRGHVVATSAKGDVFRSEELNWDQINRTVVSNKPVEITTANGDVTHGSSMETNEKFMPFSLKDQTGLFHIDSKFGQN